MSTQKEFIAQLVKHFTHIESINEEVKEIKDSIKEAGFDPAILSAVAKAIVKPSSKIGGFLFIKRKANMYWLETNNLKYEEHDGQVFSNYQDALDYYHFLIESMMRNLPKEEWFDLKLMRHGKEGDFMPERDQVVRSWVY